MAAKALLRLGMVALALAASGMASAQLGSDLLPPGVAPLRDPLPDPGELPAVVRAPLDGPAPGAGAPPAPMPDDLVGPRGDWTAAYVVGGFATLAGLAGLAVWGGTRFEGRDEVLAHEVRSAIYRHVQENVGASLKSITETLGLSTTNAVWHLRKLEDGGLVRGRKSNGAKVYYPTAGGVQARNLSMAGAALTNPNARTILAFVERHPGVHQREVARLINVNHGTVRWHLTKLRKAELLEERRVGGSAAYHVTPLGADALRHVQARQAPAAAASPAPTLAEGPQPAMTRA